MTLAPPTPNSGGNVGLSAPAVAERVRRLETSGIVTGYHAAMDLKKAGYGIVGFVRLSSPLKSSPISSSGSRSRHPRCSSSTA